MSRQLSVYADYKDSGIPWLGAIPEHWIVRRIKHTSSLQSGIPKGRAPEPNWVSLPMLRVANVQDGSLNLDDVHEIRLPPEDVARYLLRAGDVLMNEGGDRDKLGRGTIWRGELPSCVHQNHVFAIRPEGIEPEWLDAVSRAPYAKFHFFMVAKQSTNLASISSSNIKETPLLVPPRPEREAIIRFLDYETAKIDQLIDKQQQLIALLKEKRQAVISHSVTKGLNPDTHMKDSGVEWLGEVPAHWEVLKGSWLGQLFGSEAVPENHVEESGSLLFIKVSSLAIDGFELQERRFFVSDACARTVTARSDFIVFPKRGAAIFTNKVNIVHESAVIDPNLMGWIPNRRALPDYLAHVLKLRGLDDIADVSTVPQINNKHIAPMMFPVPPVAEQRSILEYVGERVHGLDLLLEKAEQQIDLLQERRTALISAAVTGKIDVRNWHPPEGEATREVA